MSLKVAIENWGSWHLEIGGMLKPEGALYMKGAL